MTQPSHPQPRSLISWLAMLAALGVIASQLLDVPAAWHEDHIVGAIEVLQAGIFVVLAYFWTTTNARWPWIVGGLVSLVALGGIILTRTVGLGGSKADVGNWGEPVTVIAMVSYVLMIVLMLLRLRNQRE